MSGKAEEDPTWALLFIVVLIGGTFWLIWHFFQDPILMGLRYIRVAELGIQSLFDSRARSCLSWLWRTHVGMDVPNVNVVESALACYGPDLHRLPTVEALKYYNFTTASLEAMTRQVAPMFRFVGIVAFSGVAIYAMYFTPLNRYKTRHNLESFIKAQSAMWPVITPILKFNPSKAQGRVPGETVPDKLPMFAEALNPEEWVSFHRIPVENSVPDREITRRAFLLQLGQRWRGTKGLPLHVLCLFAAFALQGVQRRDQCDELLGKIAMCWSPDKGLQLTPELVKEVRQLAEDPAVGGKALDIAKRHAYRASALLGILKWARFSGGVLAPAQFLWLRAVDRNLWYPLNNLGRRSFHTEGAGALAHFMAECAAGKALPIPRIETAIVTLNTYFAKSPVTVPPREEPKAVQGRTKRA